MHDAGSRDRTVDGGATARRRGHARSGVLRSPTERHGRPPRDLGRGRTVPRRAGCAPRRGPPLRASGSPDASGASVRMERSSPAGRDGAGGRGGVRSAWARRSGPHPTPGGSSRELDRSGPAARRGRADRRRRATAAGRLDRTGVRRPSERRDARVRPARPAPRRDRGPPRRPRPWPPTPTCRTARSSPSIPTARRRPGTNDRLHGLEQPLRPRRDLRRRCPWVADNAGGRAPERIGRADRPAADARAAPPRRRDPRAGRASSQVRPGRLGVCGYVSGRLDEYRIRR